MKNQGDMAGARSSAIAYSTPLDQEFFDGYYNKGNLFADGFTGYHSGFGLVELPSGSTKFLTITTTLKNTIRFDGSSDCAQTRIVKGLVYCGDAGNNNGELFKSQTESWSTAPYKEAATVPGLISAIANSIVTRS